MSEHAEYRELLVRKQVLNKAILNKNNAYQVKRDVADHKQVEARLLEIEKTMTSEEIIAQTKIAFNGV